MNPTTTCGIVIINTGRAEFSWFRTCYHLGTCFGAPVAGLELLRKLRKDYGRTTGNKILLELEILFKVASSENIALNAKSHIIPT